MKAMKADFGIGDIRTKGENELAYEFSYKTVDLPGETSRVVMLRLSSSGEEILIDAESGGENKEFTKTPYVDIRLSGDQADQFADALMVIAKNIKKNNSTHWTY